MPTTIGATTFPTGSAMSSLMSKMPGFDASSLSAVSDKPHGRALEVREKFQDFAAGTFYKEMLKALRSGQKPSKYFNGGQAEKIFRGQFDQQIAEEMAHQHGAAFANPLFEAYSRQTGVGQPESVSSPLPSGPLRSGPTAIGQVTSLEGAHALDVVA